MRLATLCTLAVASVLVSGCIFGVSTSGREEPRSDTARDSESPADTEGPAPDALDAGSGGDVRDSTGDADAGERGDGGGGGDAGGGPCTPPAEGGGSGAADSGPDAGPVVTRPEFIYVPKSNATALGIAFLDGGSVRVREVEVVAERIRALGPSLHYDRDGNREVPFVSEQTFPEGKRRFLVLLELGADLGETTTVTGDVEFDRQGRVGVADFDDDCRPDLVWADSVPSEDGDPTPAIKRVDSDSREGRPEAIVELSDTPWTVIGAVDENERDGREEAYWFDGDPGSRFVVDDDSRRVESAGEPFSMVGTNDGSPGIGGPFRVSGESTTYFPIVDGSNNPVLLPAGGGIFRPLDETGSAVKAPLGVGDPDADGDREVVFVDDGGKLSFVEADVTDPVTSEVTRIEGVERGDLDAETRPGVVSGTSDFYRRVDQDRTSR